jgi:vitamin B12 transporter
MTRVIGALVVVTLLIVNSMRVQAQEKPVQLEEVVVTATKTQTPVEQTGSSVTVIKREEIERKQATDAIQILREQPGFSLIQTGSRGGTTSIFTRGGNSDMNLVLIDGMKVNEGGGSFNFTDTSTAGIGRVEIVRGPQSALYGADAITSVIQFFTPRGEGPFSAWAAGAAGNYDTTEERAGFSWGNRLSGVFFEFDRVDTTGILDKNNEFRNHAGALRLDLSPTRELEFTLTGRFNESRFEFPTESEGDRLQPFLDPRQLNEKERFVGTFGTRYRQTGWLEHRFKSGVNFENRLSRDPRDVPPDPSSRAPEGTRTMSKEERIFLDYNAELDGPRLFGVTPLLVLGSSYESQNFTQRSRPVTTRRTNVERETHAAYGQLQLGWLDHIFLTGGTRYDSSSVFGQELTPRVSLAVVMPVARTRLRGAWGTGIKEPSFSAQFGGATFPGNPNIKSEKSRSWETGVDQPLFGQRFEIGATYFHNRFEDLIVFVSNAEGDKNIQTAKTQGIETVFTLRPIDGWSATANYTLLDTEAMATAGIGGTAFVRGEPLLRRPKHSGSISLAHERDRLTTAATLFVKGDSIDRDFSKGGSPRVTLEGYNKLDLSLAYVLFKGVAGLKNIVWKTRVQNLLNETYEEVFGFSTARLSFLTGIEVRY